MNKKDKCSCKLCMPKCQKYVKISHKRHICFDESTINKPDSHCLKLQIKKSKFSKKSAIRHKIKGFKNHHAAKVNRFRHSIFNANINEKYFVDTLKNFFILPKDEASNIWQERDLEHKYQNEKITGEHAEKIIYDEIFSEVKGPIFSSIAIAPKQILRVPNITQNQFTRRKMSVYDRVKKLIHKDLSLYKIKLASNKINRKSCKNEFIAQWFKHEYEQKYKSLESFSSVFKDIDELETTKKFCAWLRKHPEIEPPPYLLQHGLLEQSISGQTSSSESTRKLLNRYSSFRSLEINDDYIFNHFKQFKHSLILSDTDLQSIDNRFISDVDIII